MRFRRIGCSIAAVGLLLASAVGIATAQDDPPPAQNDPPGQAERGPRMRNPEFRQRMLEEFDKDGNGELDDAERQAMREKMRERREQMQERFGRGPEGPPGEGRGRGAHRGPGGPPGGGPGHHGPRPLEGLFEWFDGNRDDQLSREEFRDLAQFVHHRRHHGPPREGGAEGRGYGRRGPDGPPPGEEGERGPRGRRWGDGPGRRGPDGTPPGGPPPRFEGGGPPPIDGPPPADEGALLMPSEAADMAG